MGPTIILDKSSLQSLSRRSARELGYYFYTNVPPVLLKEIVADLELERMSVEEAQKAVTYIARKAFPSDSIANLDYYTLCISDLLGGNVIMDGRPIVGGGRSVRADDGSLGVFVDLQVEREAALRWGWGHFSEQDLKFAINWRKAVASIDLEADKRRLPTQLRARSLSELQEVVDFLMQRPASQRFLLNQLSDFLQLPLYVREWTESRWRNNGFTSLQKFSPYAAYVLRVNLWFIE
ncbi:MAG TPA: hypothetical protein VGP99_04860, partial [Tepidisphaeraceae bacterium]|nr:hypothetical protein [Tepidisphaeraceae bacterium]